MNEPIFLSPVFKEYIWGGTRLKTDLDKKFTTPTAAESWEVSTNENGKTIISNTEFKGLTLYDLFENMNIREKIFGAKSLNLNKFPILIKFIDANDNLSVQVHPDDEYANKMENDTGKTEAWYIIDCGKDSQVIYGLKQGVTKEDFKLAIENKRVVDCLNFANIEKGDVIFIPAGTVHALLKNTLLCEVQQNSDLTYRVYDWDRVGKDGKPRELHQQKALDVINTNLSNTITKTNNSKEIYTRIIDCKYFKTDLVKIENILKESSNLDTFYTFNVVEGSGNIIYGRNTIRIKLGDSFIIPANMGNYTISGNLKLLKSYI